MKSLLTTILLLTASQTFAQFDYDMFMGFSEEKSLRLNSKLSSATEFQLDDQRQWTKNLTTQFNRRGLPIAITQFDQRQAIMKKEFVYGPSGNIMSIETYEEKEHQSSAEFETNHLGQITAYTDYVYSSLDGEKIFVWHTLIEYHSNHTLKKITRLQGDKRDTSEVDFFNNKGIKTKTLMNMGGLRTVKIEYSYNKDSTEMLEQHYEDDTTIYHTITHKYKSRKKVETIDPLTSETPFYWKYDNNGNVIETNAASDYVIYFSYNPEGYLTGKTAKAIHPDPAGEDLPEKIEFKYEYRFK